VFAGEVEASEGGRYPGWLGIAGGRSPWVCEVSAVAGLRSPWVRWLLCHLSWSPSSSTVHHMLDWMPTQKYATLACPPVLTPGLPPSPPFPPTQHPHPSLPPCLDPWLAPPPPSHPTGKQLRPARRRLRRRAPRRSPPSAAARGPHKRWPPRSAPARAAAAPAPPAWSTRAHRWGGGVGGVGWGGVVIGADERWQLPSNG
jgi:hypothetical protein